jgi:signal peptidase I
LASPSPGQSPTPAPESPRREASSLAATQTIVAPGGAALARVRWIVGAALIGLLVLVGLRLWMIVGLSRTVRIDGPSMAPAWLGGHYRVTCEDCGHAFACDAQSDPGGSAGQLAVCPNCGFKDNRLLRELLASGERVVIDHWPIVFHAPERGQVVAAADPDERGGFVVKRVAGLPGERLAIRRGDLYVSGRLVRKSLHELEAVRVLVHDNRHRPERTAGLPARWKPARPTSGWYPALGGFRHEASRAVANERFDWLEYHHWLMFASHSRTRLSPVLDTDSYNQGQPRQQNAVPDVLISCYLKMRDRGRFALAATDGRQRFEVVFDTQAGSVVLREGQRALVQKDLATRFSGRGVRIEFGLCDQQVLLSVAGREVLRHEYERPPGHAPEPVHSLAIGGGASLEVTDLCIWRDLYYLAPNGPPNDWEASEPLPPGTYALLGDNTTVSTDSRQWTAGVPASQILGRVYQPFWLADDEPESD